MGCSNIQYVIYQLNPYCYGGEPALPDARTWSSQTRLRGAPGAETEKIFLNTQQLHVSFCLHAHVWQSICVSYRRGLAGCPKLTNTHHICCWHWLHQEADLSTGKPSLRCLDHGLTTRQDIKQSFHRLACRRCSRPKVILSGPPGLTRQAAFPQCHDETRPPCRVHSAMSTTETGHGLRVAGLNCNKRALQTSAACSIAP